MRTIGVVSVARSDYSIYLPVLRAIQANPDLDLYLIASGMHLSPEFGNTVQVIEADGFPIQERVEFTLSSNTAEGIGKSLGLGVIGFAQVFGRFQPDILLVLGDRYEMFAAACASLPFNIPLAHLHGGELTFGAMDESIRHAITKLSHLHFTSTEAYAQNVIRMGEEPWRVTVSGAPALDNMAAIPLLDKKQLEAQFGLDLAAPPLLVTFHPVTREVEQTGVYFNELLAALDTLGLPVVFTYPNADAQGRTIIQRIEAYVQSRPQAQVVANFSTQGYYSMLNAALAMVGNSSSGIIEAASFTLPVVNIGNRQQGRLHGENVVHSAPERSAIIQAVEMVTQLEFKAALQGMVNPYGDGKAAEKIVSVLVNTEINVALIAKRFYRDGQS
ncbi:MAG: UDP-N-acetylglucosamine 2-epimerase (hydrolyzing) [Anaerolineales bacterium]|nr:UDP-N-acetylglucosamine 2-epimerase (hydrolyzing) [Anaerolineales bacterium]